MTCKNFRIATILQVTGILLTTAVLQYIVINTSLVTSAVILFAILVTQTMILIRFVDKTNRDLSRFLLAISHSDFSVAFRDKSRGGTFIELNRSFEDVVSRLRKLRADREAGYLYLKTVVEHVKTGLLAFRPDGRIEFINRAARRLLDVEDVRTIRDLAAKNDRMPSLLQSIKPRKNLLFNGNIDGELRHLSLSATELKHEDRLIKLVAVQDIGSELAEKEMQAWQQLMSVLMHEILNSVTPVSSLASAAGDMLKTSTAVAGEPDDCLQLNKADIIDLKESLDTIQRRCKGLIQFINSHRSLTHLPVPEFQIVSLQTLMENIMKLAFHHSEINGTKITTDVKPPTLELTADPALMEQVLLNLLINSLNALAGRDNGKIELKSFLDKRGRVIIQVIDNGPGIAPGALEKIFVPFYTTKEGGSGIGLSLSRQIIRLHKGEIGVESKPDAQTVFTLRF